MANHEPQFLQEIFDRTASNYPDKIALEIPPGFDHPNRIQFTYAQLKSRADSLAAALRTGAKSDSIIAIFLPRSTPELYIAQLAVLKSGAAFTCLDANFPDEHLRWVLEDAQPVAVITNAQGKKRIESLGWMGTLLSCDDDAFPPLPVLPERAGVRADEDCRSTESQALTPALSQNTGRGNRDLAYVIYTSGTTGKPKGVLSEHSGIVNLVNSDIAYFQLACTERVAQCSSPAYDSSIEETWLAWAVGATLVPMDDQTVRLGPDLVSWLASERITVLCPPPTLLAMTGCENPHEALPDLKLLYVGGEALPQDLADRWSIGRWMENGYGPTECTVTALRGRIQPGQPITIGKPVAGNQAWILDENLVEVPDGQNGELCIGGIGLSRGYLHQETLTRERFPIHKKFGRIYRTGDLARREAGGDFIYLGRIDSQVKLRGYRIELEAIESQLATHAGVRAAACKVQGEGADQKLAAYIVPAGSVAPPDFESLKKSLRKSLPEYMIPSRFAFLEQLPVTVGSKLNRNALADIADSSQTSQREITPPRTSFERNITDAFKSALKLNHDVSIHDDFFLDLGGNSLSAVAVILKLRAAGNESATSITVRDIYEARTVAGLAKLHSRQIPRPARNAAARSAMRVNPMVCTIIQIVWLALELLVGGAVGYLMLFGLLPIWLNYFGLGGTAVITILAAFLLTLLYLPISLAFLVLLKRILIGRYKPGRQPVWGSFFIRHWIVCNIAGLVPWWLIEGTDFFPAALRFLGAKIGRYVHIHRGVDLIHGGWDLLHIGDHVTLAQDSSARTIELVSQQLVMDRIVIGDWATLDVRAGMSPGSEIERDGYLSPLSWLPSGEFVKESRQWNGVPAISAGPAPARPVPTRGGELPPKLHATLVVIFRCGAILLPLILLSILWILLPSRIAGGGQWLTAWLDNPGISASGLTIVFALAIGALAINLIFQAILMRMIGRIRPGVVNQGSFDAIRIWTKTRLAESAGQWLSGSLFWPIWLRIAGMKLGDGCEISTIIDILPEMISIGSRSFFADGIYLCAPWRHRGTITIAPSQLGRDTFIGNHAVIPAGHEYPEKLFVGVATVPNAAQVKPDTAWFGHPPMQLPRRQVVASDKSLTHNPPPLRHATRLFWELLRFTMVCYPIFLGIIWYLLMNSAGQNFGPIAMALLIAPAFSAGVAVALCLAIIIVKWVLLGRAKPGQHAFWSCWCGRWDFLYMAWEYWGTFVLTRLDGTLLLNIFLRLTGVRIGKRVVLDFGFHQFVDPDMLIIDDDATVSCQFQSHSFEDRVLKLDHIHIGRGSTLGDNAIVFFGTKIGDGSTIMPHSVVMKNDILEPDETYGGNPSHVV